MPPLLKLPVPYVAQNSVLGDREEDMMDMLGCWYAAIRMVGYYFEEGPRLGLPEKFAWKIVGYNYLMHYPIYFRINYVKKFFSPGTIELISSFALKLMGNENLVACNHQIPNHGPKQKSQNIYDLRMLLLQYGPIILTIDREGQSGRHYSHCYVVVGIEDENYIITHDPTLGADRTQPFSILKQYADFDFLALRRKSTLEASNAPPVILSQNPLD